MLVVGEKINTSVPGVEEAVKARDETFLHNLAQKQLELGADMLDINVGTRIHSEVEDIKWLVKTVQEAVDIPLCIDSPSSKAVEAGLAECKSKAMVNSITAEKERIAGIIPLIRRGGFVHFYTFRAANEIDILEARFRGMGLTVRKVTRCGNVAPGIARWAFDMRRR